MDFKEKNNPFYGKKHTNETKKKIAFAIKNRKPIAKRCIRCNKKIIARVYNKKYCDDCKKLTRKEIMRRVDKKRSNNPKRKQQKILIKRRHNQTEKAKEKNNLWRKTERGRLNAKISNLKRRERIAGVSKAYTKFQILQKIDETGGVCPKCKVAFTKERLHKLTIDHNPPLATVSKGFVYTIKELGTICWSCNSKKNQWSFKRP